MIKIGPKDVGRRVRSKDGTVFEVAGWIPGAEHPAVLRRGKATITSEDLDIVSFADCGPGLTGGTSSGMTRETKAVSSGMTRETYLQEFKWITDRMYEITKAKNSDYTGDDNNPFDNFEAVARLGIASTEQGFLTRMTDKFMRITSFVKKGTLQVKDESVQDTLLDLANYSILLACYIKSGRRRGPVELGGSDEDNQG